MGEKYSKNKEGKGKNQFEIFILISILSTVLVGFYHKYIKKDGVDLEKQEIKDAESKIKERLTHLQNLHNLYLKTEDIEEKKKIMTTEEIDEMRELFALVYAPLANEIYDKYQIPVAITLAQAVLESASASSGLFQKSNNYFGLKCREHKGKDGKYDSHCVNHKDDYETDRFLKFNSDEDSFMAYAERLLEYRYRNCFKCGDNYKCWAKELKKAGYATNQNYAEKLIELIEKYELYKYTSDVYVPRGDY